MQGTPGLGEECCGLQGDVKKLTEDIAALKPTVFSAVPRVLERIQVRCFPVFWFHSWSRLSSPFLFILFIHTKLCMLPRKPPCLSLVFS